MQALKQSALPHVAYSSRQRFHRRDARRAMRRQQARRQRDGGHHRHRDRERRDVNRRDTEKQTLERVAGGPGAGEAEGDTRRKQPRGDGQELAAHLAGAAPSAMRRPISRRRCETA